MTGTAPPVVPLRDVLRDRAAPDATSPAGDGDPWMGARYVAFRGRRAYMTRGQQAMAAHLGVRIYTYPARAVTGPPPGPVTAGQIP